LSNLLPLTALAIAHAKPGPPGTPPVLAYLPLSSLRIDDRYQRRIEGRGVRVIARICAEFDWDRFAPLIVARVPGGEIFSIIDGQHRATAAMIRGFDRVPCSIVTASPKEQPAIFTDVNGNTTPITIFQLFKAGRAAGAEWALDIDRACKLGGIVPLVYPKPKSTIKPFETMALGTLRRNIARFGVEEMGAALAHAAKQQGANEPGFWNSMTVDQAIGEWRTLKGKRPEAPPDSQITMGQRIRDLRKKGYSRFAIQAAIPGVKLADIEAAFQGET